jgi:DUF1365 family protein
MHSALYIGRLRHRRHLPRPHAFAYAVYMMWLDLAELDSVFRGRWFWSTRRRALAWFRRADYLGDPELPLDEAVRRRVMDAGQPRPTGPIRMLAQLRSYGHCFNPVTFYYCYDAAGTRIETVVAEITNTPWKERHAYVLPVPAAQPAGGALDFAFGKAFHVSPFMPMDVGYHWRFSEPGARLAVYMENTRGGQSMFDASLTLSRREITGPALAGVLLRFPFSTLGVLAAIYWQALRLKLKGMTFHEHPRLAPPMAAHGGRRR